MNPRFVKQTERGFFLCAQPHSYKPKAVGAGELEPDGGGTNRQALLSGLAAGAAEALFEKVSVERLLNERSVRSMRDLLAETLKQAGTEASEEMLTEVSNLLSDAAIMGSGSNFAARVDLHRQDGLGAEAARRRAFLDCLSQVALAGVGGALSGGVMGGTVRGANYLSGAWNQVQSAGAAGTTGQNHTASTEQAGEYRANRPQNVELPNVPIINLSMQSVADMNGGVLPEKGNYLRKTAFADAVKRLGLDKNKAVYIEASNVTRNGDEYVIKITKPSLNKMLSASSYPDKVVPLESIAILGQLERIAQNGVYFKSEGDRKSRPQVAGYDHLETTVYIDNIPYVVDMRVRVEDEQSGGANRLYHFTPEAISVTRKNDGTTSTVGRRATNVHSSDAVPSFNSIISENPAGGNARSARNRAGVTAVGDEYLQQALDEVWQGAEGPSVRGPQEDGIHTLEAVDRRPAGLYDGNNLSSRTGGVINGGGKEAFAAREGIVGTDIWDGIERASAPSGVSKEVSAEDGRVPGVGRAPKWHPEWAQGHIVEPSNNAARKAVGIAERFVPDVFVVEDAALKRVKQNSLARTSNGKIYFSDAIPSELAEVIAYHEVIHAIKHSGSLAYETMLDEMSSRFNRASSHTEKILDFVTNARFEGKQFIDLSPAEVRDVFDELNAIIWGYYRVDPENAYTQFADLFIDYNTYLQDLDNIAEELKSKRDRLVGKHGEDFFELDAIMERARQRNEVGQSGYRERPGISIERILEEGWRDEAPSVRGPEEDGVHNQERPQLLDSAENAGYDESTVWEGHRELDQDGNPVYAVTRREANIQPEDLRALQRKQRETAKRLGMDEAESSRLEQYVRGFLCYSLNKRMNLGTQGGGEQEIAADIQRALEKFREYNGRAYRNLKFDSKEEYDAFLAEYAEGSSVTLRAFTSTSKRPNGYPLFGGGVVHLVVDGYSGRDIADTYGLSRQQEVLYLPGTEMSVIRVTTANDGNPLIYLKEADDGKHRGENSEDFGDRGPA